MDISSIIDKIKSSVTGTLPSFPTLPAMMLACSLAKRPGLSVTLSVANIVSALKQKGFPTGKMPDGQPNYTTMEIHEIVSEIYDSISKKAKGQSVHKPGSIRVVGTATGPFGTAVVNAQNIGYVTGENTLN